ncbi:hypothetical protein BXZ70DRAFT_1013348 [Cristinia sonorae]|uniref:Uncharacterized protein n=1 Tax=Cristinia sonorae TaxID=1940300 RepID=A0A8K0UEP2_9AGAR|nr:hypothetical protein BXZ70DRAFT_1013348 [Cristinia sonorae]
MGAQHCRDQDDGRDLHSPPHVPMEVGDPSAPPWTTAATSASAHTSPWTSATPSTPPHVPLDVGDPLHTTSPACQTRRGGFRLYGVETQPVTGTRTTAAPSTPPHVPMEVGDPSAPPWTTAATPSTPPHVPLDVGDPLHTTSPACQTRRGGFRLYGVETQPVTGTRTTAAPSTPPHVPLDVGDPLHTTSPACQTRRGGFRLYGVETQPVTGTRTTAAPSTPPHVPMEVGDPSAPPWTTAATSASAHTSPWTSATPSTPRPPPARLGAGDFDSTESKPSPTPGPGRRRPLHTPARPLGRRRPPPHHVPRLPDSARGISTQRSRNPARHRDQDVGRPQLKHVALRSLTY